MSPSGQSRPTEQKPAVPSLPLRSRKRTCGRAAALDGFVPIPDEADARRIMQIVLGDHSVEFETKHWNLDKVGWFCPIGFSQFLMRKGEIPTRV
jgi:hypothetical protein